MNKQTLILLLSLVAAFCLGYGIYRSLAERITTVDNGTETVYNDPQHGLILGLMIVAATCIASIIYIVTRRVGVAEHNTVQHLRTEQPLVNPGSSQSSYRPLS